MLLGKELHTKKNVAHKENDNLGLPKKLIKTIIVVINTHSCFERKSNWTELAEFSIISSAAPVAEDYFLQKSLHDICSEDWSSHFACG